MKPSRSICAVAAAIFLSPLRAAAGEASPLEAEVNLSPPALVAGEVFDLEVTVRWAGAFDQYLLHPPELTLPEEVQKVGCSAETSTREGEWAVTYHFRLRASESGDFPLRPILLRYGVRDAAEPGSLEIPGPVLRVASRGLLATSQGLWLGGAGAFVAVLGALFWIWRRTPAGAPEDDGLQDLDGELAALRRLRREGSAAELLRRLRRLEESLGLAPAGELENLDRQLEETRFAGVTPSSGELDELLRRAARRLRQVREDREGLAGQTVSA